jgi:hypothetical protein
MKSQINEGMGILMPQSPDGFDQSKYYFAEEMGLVIVFSCFV